MQDNNKISHLFNTAISDYPEVENIPWAYSDFDKKFIEWSSKTQNYLAYENSLLRPIQNQLNNKLHCDSTQKRLQQYLNDKSNYLKSFEKLLKPFIDKKQAIVTLDKQNILSYQDLIFRDWSWGKEEIDIYLDYILKNLTGTEKNILVLGAGACGLSHKLAQMSDANIIATDINPYLFLAGQKLTNNKKIKTFEFLDSPKELKFYSYKNELKGAQKQENHFQVFCDFFDLPFKPKSFDTIISCWFYDILPTDLEDSILHSNCYLNDTGKNIFIGPQNFHKSQISKQLTPIEIIERFEKYYAEVSSEKIEMNYLKNPKNSAFRFETILFSTSSKPLEEKKYISNNSEQITLTTELLTFKQKIEVFNRILKYVDKDMSYKDLASKIKNEFGFTDEESLFYAESFIQKILSEV